MKRMLNTLLVVQPLCVDIDMCGLGYLHSIGWL